MNSRKATNFTHFIHNRVVGDRRINVSDEDLPEIFHQNTVEDFIEKIFDCELCYTHYLF